MDAAAEAPSLKRPKPSTPGPSSSDEGPGCHQPKRSRTSSDVTPSSSAPTSDVRPVLPSPAHASHSWAYLQSPSGCGSGHCMYHSPCYMPTRPVPMCQCVGCIHSPMHTPVFHHQCHSMMMHHVHNGGYSPPPRHSFFKTPSHTYPYRLSSTVPHVHSHQSVNASPVAAQRDKEQCSARDWTPRPFDGLGAGPSMSDSALDTVAHQQRLFAETAHYHGAASSVLSHSSSCCAMSRLSAPESQCSVTSFCSSPVTRRRPENLQQAICMYIDNIIEENENLLQISHSNFPAVETDYESESYAQDVLSQTAEFPTQKFRKWLKRYNVDIEVAKVDEATLRAMKQQQEIGSVNLDRQMSRPSQTGDNSTQVHELNTPSTETGSKRHSIDLAFPSQVDESFQTASITNNLNNNCNVQVSISEMPFRVGSGSVPLNTHPYASRHELPMTVVYGTPEHQPKVHTAAFVDTGELVEHFLREAPSRLEDKVRQSLNGNSMNHNLESTELVERQSKSDECPKTVTVNVGECPPTPTNALECPPTPASTTESSETLANTGDCPDISANDRDTFETSASTAEHPKSLTSIEESSQALVNAGKGPGIHGEKYQGMSSVVSQTFDLTFAAVTLRKDACKQGNSEVQPDKTVETHIENSAQATVPTKEIYQSQSVSKDCTVNDSGDASLMVVPENAMGQQQVYDLFRHENENKDPNSDIVYMEIQPISTHDNSQTSLQPVSSSQLDYTCASPEQICYGNLQQNIPLPKLTPISPEVFQHTVPQVTKTLPSSSRAKTVMPDLVPIKRAGRFSESLPEGVRYNCSANQNPGETGPAPTLHGMQHESGYNKTGFWKRTKPWKTTSGNKSWDSLVTNGNSPGLSWQLPSGVSWPSSSIQGAAGPTHTAYKHLVQLMSDQAKMSTSPVNSADGTLQPPVTAVSSSDYVASAAENAKDVTVLQTEGNLLPCADNSNHTNNDTNTTPADSQVNPQSAGTTSECSTEMNQSNMDSVTSTSTDTPETVAAQVMDDSEMPRDV